MDRIFGMILLHNHFSLENDEYLVEYLNTSTPWKYGSGPGSISDLSRKIHSCTWAMLKDGTIRPYEFKYNPSGPCIPQPDPASEDVRKFLSAFKTTIEKHNMEGVWGLCAYLRDDYRGRREISGARANISLLPEDVSVHARISAKLNT